MAASLSALPNKISGARGMEASEMGMEDELRMADMEVRLRQMVVDLLRPTVARMTSVQNDSVELKRRVAMQDEAMQVMQAEVKLAKERSNAIEAFKFQMDDFSQRLSATDSHLAASQTTAQERLDGLERKTVAQASWNERCDKILERCAQDLDLHSTELKTLGGDLEVGLSTAKKQLIIEAANLRTSLEDLAHQVEESNGAVWGEEDCNELSQVSLRRLDLQMRKVSTRMADALADLSRLRRLDTEVQNFIKEEEIIKASVSNLVQICEDLGKKTDEVAEGAKEEGKLAANKMAAFTASLMKDVRGSFGDDVRALQDMHVHMKTFVQETKDGVEGLQTVLRSVTSHTEASLMALRADVDSQETRNRQEQKSLRDDLSAMSSETKNAFEASETVLVGLEHMSKVMQTTLMGERVSVALDLQDFVDRKTVPYVGLKSSAPGEATQEKKPKKDVDPAQLTRLFYKPRPVLFQGVSRDRAQLLALRERLLHAAQEALMEGPARVVGATKKAPMDAFLQGPPPTQLVPASLGISAEVLLQGRAGGETGHPGRPGSRGQPSARGSPGPEELQGSRGPPQAGCVKEAPAAGSRGPSQASCAKDGPAAGSRAPSQAGSAKAGSAREAPAPAAAAPGESTPERAERAERRGGSVELPAL